MPAHPGVRFALPHPVKEAQCLKKRSAEIVLKDWGEPEPVTGDISGRLAEWSIATAC